jgi:hypothetical protein
MPSSLQSEFVEMEINDERDDAINSNEMEETTAAAKWFDLRPNRDLLDSNFDGYKLSLDSLNNSKIKIPSVDIYNYMKSDDNQNSKCFVFQHLKLIGLQNHLISNQFDESDSNLYYFDNSQRLIQIDSFNNEYKTVVTNFKLPSTLANIKNRLNPTMKFVNKQLAVIFDGYDSLYFCRIEVNNEWTVIHK